MITETEAKCDRFGESSYSLKAELEQLTRLIKADKQEFERLSGVSKYTPEIKQRRTQLSEAIERNLQHQRDIERMLELPIGSWVKNGSTTPGQIVDLKIAGQIPEVHVLWWNHTVPVPERPLRLTPLDPAELEYIWNGEERPKLIRRIDRVECDEIQVLQTVLGQLAVNKRSAMAKDLPIEQIELYRMKQTYIRKRIVWVNKQDLERLERVVRQGLEIFYRVGSALAEIRDRKLYKELGYSNFRDYLDQRWNMKKSQAYRLIDSAEVVKNLSPKNESHGTQDLLPDKSVPNWGQNEPIAYQPDKEQSEILIPTGHQVPKTEGVAREIGKAPPEKQQFVWKESCDRFGDNPTAKQVKSVVAEIISTVNPGSNCTDSSSTVLISSTDKPSNSTDKPSNSTDKPIVDRLEVKQIVSIVPSPDRPDKRLLWHARSTAVITAVNPASVDIKLVGKTIPNVSPNDLQLLDKSDSPTIRFSPSHNDYAELVINFDSEEEIIKAAIAWRKSN